MFAEYVTLKACLIVCPLIFLAGFVDSIAGGGGLISLPAYLLAGVPTHVAIGTNKLSSFCGTSIATGKYIKNGQVNFKIGVPSIVLALAGSAIGSSLSLLSDERIMQYILLGVLPITAAIVLNKNLFKADDTGRELILNKKVWLSVLISAFVIGMYDGFYGPGTGTFLIIIFTVVAGMNTRQANGQAKIINLSTNLAALAVNIANGKVLFGLGIVAALFNMLGAYIGSNLAIKNGSKIVKPVIIIVIAIIIAKILIGF